MQAINPTPTGPHPVIAASMRWFTPQAEAEAESRARVFDSMANSPGTPEDMAHIYLQNAQDIRRAAAVEGGAA